MRRCAVEVSGGAFCDAPSVEATPFPICAEHARQIFEWVRGQSPLTMLRQQLLAEQRLGVFGRETKVPVREPRVAVVYYLRMDGMIKIGTTGNLKHRIAAYPPYAQLLVTEPGSHELETRRHREFNEYLLSGKEWFAFGDRLRIHIERLQLAAPV